jgi:hypothetical protein
MVLASTYDQARFLKAADLDGGEKRVRIKSVTEEKVGPDKDQKLVVWFTTDKRGFVLNQTNNRVLREAFGDETDGWAGKIVVLFSSMIDFRGRMTQGLRVRIPPPKGDGHAAAAKPKPAPKPDVVDEGLDAEPPAKPAAKPSLADDLDDEIPWR